ncbi:MAG: metallophosphoesterase family protein [Planctomycetota bacterium]
MNYGFLLYILRFLLNLCDMFAVISDIHSNLEALATVLADIEKRGIKTIYCLGDVIGYGPNPKECLDLIIQRTKWCVLGNHDYAVFYEPTNFNYGAEQASFWTRAVLETEQEANDRNRRWSFLGELPMRRTLKTKLGTNTATIDFIHASPRLPVNEYIFPDDVYTNPQKVRFLFERVKHICFVGHTHLPGVFLDEPDFYLPDELGNVYPVVDKEKAIINIGSVGQPRDKDNRASYVYANENEVHFVRLAYDFETTAKKIMAIEELDSFQAERLWEGR